MPDVILSGLDGSNPLGFLAAAGVLAAVSQSPRARMTWRYNGVWHPVIDSEHADLDALMSYLDADRRECLTDQALQLTYDGKRDLKPPPGEFRGYLIDLLASAEPTARRSIDWAAAFGTDVAVDNKGNTKPTALHFTAGQQQFLQMVAELSQQVGPDDLREALAGPWRYARPLPVMGWDATSSRDYALRGSDPSTDKKLGVPGADWLAVRGLTFLPCMPKGRRVATTACRGGWKDGVFTWPLWDGSLSARTVRSLLGFDVQGLSADERQSRGVVAVFSSAIKRSDQGGYGSFAPAATV